MTALRNIAIIAHVDHGKTTLVDQLLRQSGLFRDNQRVAERVMDSGDLEKERGITILAKCTSVEWKNTRINIVDTPGHADFGGEVERIMSMVDGVVLLVDAAEGPMPQTRFVTGKALSLGLKPIVVVNKIDKSDARPWEVQNEVFDLFSLLDATDEQLDFPTIFATARDGVAGLTPQEAQSGDLSVLFDRVLDYVPAPRADDTQAPFRMLATLLEADPYVGRVLTGRIMSGKVSMNMPIHALRLQGDGGKAEIVERARATKLLGFRGLERISLEEASAGDIIALAGLEHATVADTICTPETTAAIPAQPIDPPTLSMTFSVNDSPLAGREGSKVQSRVIAERLAREAEGNVAIKITPATQSESFEVSGRGELQLSVLIEQMRREGFELSIGRPQVILKKDDATGEELEPIEEVVIDVDEQYGGVVMDAMNARRATMTEMRPGMAGKTRLIFHAPSRGLIGYHGRFLSDTRGTGIMNKLFHGYAALKGTVQGRHQGVLISTSAGNAVAYALWNLEERGVLFIAPATKVYGGMIIGESSRTGDLEVNPLKSKQLTNFRAAGSDENIRLTPPRLMSLEQAIAYIEDDEIIEVTPESIRLRKRFLDPHERKRAGRT